MRLSDACAYRAYVSKGTCATKAPYMPADAEPNTRASQRCQGRAPYISVRSKAGDPHRPIEISTRGGRIANEGDGTKGLAPYTPDPRRIKMLDRLRQRTQDEGGFTLIELLVVILIIGILSAIAIPAFLSQKSKANDAAAKTQVGTMQTAIETYSTEHNGSYAGATLAELKTIEPALNDVSTAKALETSGLSATGYTIESEAVGTKDVFKLANVAGVITRTCTVGAGSSGGGCPKGTW